MSKYKFPFIKKISTPGLLGSGLEYRVVSQAGKDMGTYDTHDEAIILLQCLTKSASSTDSIDMSGMDDFSYSAAMRVLRENDDEQLVTLFRTVFKTAFDSLHPKDPDRAADRSLILTFRVLSHKYNITGLGHSGHDILNARDAASYQNKVDVVRFSHVDKNLYRGGAPSTEALQQLKNLGIEQIVSLDPDVAKKIDPVCRKLGLRHVTIPILAKNFKAVGKLAGIDWAEMFRVPTYLHCLHGKDRTGLVVALYRCQTGVDCDSAIKEADCFDFCTGLPDKVRKVYEMVIRGCCEDHDDNAVYDLWPDSIADYKFDQSYELNDPSFGVRLTENTEVNPYGSNSGYEYGSGWDRINDSGSTRDNQEQDLQDKKEYLNDGDHVNESNVPAVGLLDNVVNLNGLGPVGWQGGFAAMNNNNNTILKRSYQVQMSYDISDAEHMYANNAIAAFDVLLGSIKLFSGQLDKMLIPFKENQDITSEQIFKFRSTFRGFRDEALTRLNDVKSKAFSCVAIMMHFVSDTQVEKIMKSFNMCVEDVTKQLKIFSILFDNLQAQDFKTNIVKSIQAIKKETAQLKQIIEERIQNYLETDILAKSWTDTAGDRDNKLKEKIPYDVELFNQQQTALQEHKDKSQ